MTSFYEKNELEKIGFKELGDNVLISRKASIYSPEKISLGNCVRIDDFCILSGNIEIGNYVHIAAYAALYGGKSGIKLEDFVGISSRTTIYAASDDYSGKTMTNPMVPDKFRNVLDLPVHIKRHVIIGATSVVFPGVCLEEGSCFGSFSLINKNSEPWSMYAGIPAKKNKERNKKILELENEMKKELKNM